MLVLVSCSLSLYNWSWMQKRKKKLPHYRSQNYISWWRARLNNCLNTARFTAAPSSQRMQLFTQHLPQLTLQKKATFSHHSNFPGAFMYEEVFSDGYKLHTYSTPIQTLLLPSFASSHSCSMSVIKACPFSSIWYSQLQPRFVILVMMASHSECTLCLLSLRRTHTI